MFISFVILFLYVCYALYRPNRAVLACFPISMLFTTLPLFSFGKTFVGLDFVLCLIAIIIAVTSKSGLSMKTCPLRKVLLAFVGGFIVVFFLGEYRSSVYPLIVKIVSYLFPIFLWKRLRTAKDIKIILRMFVLFSVVVGVYTIMECLAGSNFWMEWLQGQTTASIYVDHHDDIRFGFGRCNSFFHFPIPLGDYCALILIFFLFWQMNAKMKVICGGHILDVLFFDVCLSSIIKFKSADCCFTDRSSSYQYIQKSKNVLGSCHLSCCSLCIWGKLYFPKHRINARWLGR